MPEYIERINAIKCVESQCVDGKMWGNDETEGTLIEAYSTIDALMDIPAADVAPVVHGRWEKKKHKIYGNDYDFVCSCCGCNYALAEYNYRPHCGARMDGDRK